MGTRIAVLSLAVAALVFSPALAADKAKPAPSSMMRGSIISVMDGKALVLGKEGKKITTFKFGKELKVICNGKKCGLKDLIKDLPVTVTYTTNTENVLYATKIESNTEKPGR